MTILKLPITLFAAALIGAPSFAMADTGSTAAIVAGAAGIVGALIYDSSNHPYYVNQGRRYYVSDQQANTYRMHHRVTMRRAYVPEQEMPIGRSYSDHNQPGMNHRGQR